MQQTGQDSAGRPVRAGDVVKYRGRLYTVEGFEPGIGRFGCAGVTFTEQSHVEGEEPDEISIDLAGQ